VKLEAVQSMDLAYELVGRLIGVMTKSSHLSRPVRFAAFVKKLGSTVRSEMCPLLLIYFLYLS
jgi:hypothetical protein